MFASFSGDASHLLTSDGTGFRIFALPPTAPAVAKVRDEIAVGPVTLLAALPHSDIVAVVGPTAGAHGHGRRLRLYDVAKDEVLTELFFEAEVLAVRMNVKRICVVMERHTHLFDLGTLQPLPQIRTSHPLNSRGLGALSDLSADASCYFAFAQSADSSDDKRGDVLVLEAIDASHLTVITAHKAPVVALEFAPRGDALVTASAKGNVIRVFAIPDGQPMFAFRRGQAEALVYSVALAADLSLCAVLSNTGTMHVFRSSDKAAGGTAALGGEGAKSFAKQTVRKEPGRCCFTADGSGVFLMYPPRKQLPAGEAATDAASAGAQCLQTGGVPLAVADSGALLQYAIEGDKLRLQQEIEFS